jgi:hypothetical protein
MEIWDDLKIWALQMFQPQTESQIFTWYSQFDKQLISFISSTYPRVPELSICQQIGLSEFLLQPFVCGITALFINKKHWQNTAI